MAKPKRDTPHNRRERGFVGGFTVKDQLVGKIGLRGYGALLDQLARTTRPERKPRGRRPYVHRDGLPRGTSPADRQKAATS